MHRGPDPRCLVEGGFRPRPGWAGGRDRRLWAGPVCPMGRSPCRGPHLPSWVRILLLEMLKDSLAAPATGTMAPGEPQGLACPGRSAVSALLPAPEARARRLSGTCLLGHFFSWQEADRKVPPFLPELPCLGFVPLGVGARKARGEGRVHETGSSEAPQSTSRAAGGSDPCPTDPEAEQR